MNFNVDSLPYLYHIEYTDNWTHKSKGVFVDINGVEYRYKDRQGWKLFNDDKEIDFNEMQNLEPELHPTISKIVIKPEVLFHNLNLCRKKKPFISWFSKNKEALSAEMIEDLMNCEVVYTSDEVIYDTPTKTYSLLVYNSENVCYKQVLLSSTGSRSTQNSSVYTDSLVAKFPRL